MNNFHLFIFVSGCIQNFDFYQDTNYVLNQSFEPENAVNEILCSLQAQQNQTGNKYICQACGASYKHKRNWSRHAKFECGHKPQYMCPVCSKPFTRNHTLLRHMRVLH